MTSSRVGFLDNYFEIELPYKEDIMLISRIGNHNRHQKYALTTFSKVKLFADNQTGFTVLVVFNIILRISGERTYRFHSLHGIDLLS